MKSNASDWSRSGFLNLSTSARRNARNVSTVSAEGDAEAVSSARPAAAVSASVGRAFADGQRATTAFSVNSSGPSGWLAARRNSHMPASRIATILCLVARGLRSGSAGRTDSSLRAADFLSGRSTHPHRMVQSDPTDAHGNLFPIFLLSLIQFFLVPITLWRVGSWAIDAAYGDKEKKGAAASAVAAPGCLVGVGQPPPRARRAGYRRAQARALFSGANLWLLAFWRCPPPCVHRVLAGGGGRALRPVQGPERARGCGRVRDQEGVPRALAAVPSGQEPGPRATRIFTEQITPAYKTLTDDAARENYEKYGHPDGKQAPKLGVALPQWMFGKDGTGPIVLIALVAFGILAPVPRRVRHHAHEPVRRVQRRAPPDPVLLRARAQAALSAGKAARVLSVAMEYINIPYGRERRADQKLLASLKSEVDAKDPKFLKRHPAIVKAHALPSRPRRARRTRWTPRCAQTCARSQALPDAVRRGDARVPLPGEPDWLRVRSAGAVALEFSQCVTQAVRAPRGRTPNAAKDASEGGTVSLLRLPHVDEKVALALARKGKVRGAGELASLAGAEKRGGAGGGGPSAAQVSDVESHLAFVRARRFWRARSRRTAKPRSWSWTW